MTIETSDGRWPDGSYVFEFELDGRAHTCVLDVPSEVPEPSDTLAKMNCEPDIGLTFGFELGECEPPQQGLCRDPERWSLRSNGIGFVESVRLSVTRDGVQIFEQSRKVAYNFPFDATCYCQRGSVAFSIP